MAEIENPTETAIEEMEVVREEERENGGTKREREEGEEEEKEDGLEKKLKGDQSFEEDRLVKSEEKEEGEVKLGPKVFTTSVEMFDYFNKLLRSWNPDYDINKYEHLVLADLIARGHADPARKVGCGVSAFEVRLHPVYKSRCFFVRRADGSSDDFSFRKCVDRIRALPEDLKIPAGGGGRGGRGRGRGRGRGGRRGRRG